MIDKTGKFMFPQEIKPLGGNFLVNNMSTIKQPEEKQSLSPNKAMLNSKYSYSWQKFLKTNQEMKKKLLENKS